MKKIFLILIITLFIFIGCEIPEAEIVEETGITSIEYTNVFTISGVQRERTTFLELNSPYLTYNEEEYDLTGDCSSSPFSVKYSDNIRTISLAIDIDFFTLFYFINNNMLEIKEIDPNGMTEDEFIEMLTFIYEPDYSFIKFHLSAAQGSVSDSLYVNSDNILINGQTYYFDSFQANYIDDIKTYLINITIDSSDSFLFINNNMYDFFGIDLSNMSLSELAITAEILNLYPETGILDLQEVY